MTPTTDHAPCILLVDDNADALRLLDGALGEAGYEVAIARSGESALRELEKRRPEAVLLDVVMPGIDGFETCARMRERYDDLPVIFMTGLGETEHILRGFAVGGIDYVTKPVQPPVVIARLQAHTRTARLLRATRDAIDASNHPMLAIDADGRLLWSNRAAGLLLARAALPGVLAGGDPLPPPLAPIADLGRGVEQVSLRGLTARRAAELSHSLCVVSLAEASEAPDPTRMPPRLTAREGEVLLWVARGKTNRDIADILGMSPRTVNKHLEHVFEKLGVETRTAAAAAARRLNLDPGG